MEKIFFKKNIKNLNFNVLLVTIMVSTEIEIKGHIIDSLILPKIFGTIMDMGGEFKILQFDIGKSKSEESYAKMKISAKAKHQFHHILGELQKLGAIVTEIHPVITEAVTKKGVAPDNFYSTTNHLTWVYHKNGWIPVENIEMDCFIVIEENKAFCRSMNKLEIGDMVVIGSNGIKITLPERSRSADVFEFMNSGASSEKPTESLVRKVALAIKHVKDKGGKIVVVAGPAIIHAGSRDALAELIKNGYVDAMLTGNAVATHDIEASLLGTSLGVDLHSVYAKKGGHRHHIFAINTIRKIGSITAAVESGKISSGIMYECIKNNIPFVLAGSIRDDGPLPEVVTDSLEAQDAMRELLKRCDLVLMLSSLLHSVAVGNMIPSHVKTICVDINPASVTKLLDRGTAQAIGITTDVGLFLPKLRDEILKK